MDLKYYNELKINVNNSETNCVINNQSTTVLIKCIIVYLNDGKPINTNYNLLIKYIKDINLQKLCNEVAQCIKEKENDNIIFNKLNNINIYLHENIN